MATVASQNKTACAANATALNHTNQKRKPNLKRDHVRNAAAAGDANDNTAMDTNDTTDTATA